MAFISIAEASAASGKSIQTIRRMVKAKRLAVKKQKTPQGFVYLVSKASLEKFAKSTPLLFPQTGGKKSTPPIQAPIQHSETRVHAGLDLTSQKWQNELEKFSTTIRKLIEQNERDKDNFFALIKSFQDRVFVLENQIKLLEAPKKKWWKLWR